MLYSPDYFDTCNGLVPQIVLSSMLLQAGNNRTRAYANVFQTDISDTTTWNLAGDLSDVTYLNISGWLPVMESRYLISQQSIVSRVSAMNQFNVDIFADAVGLPQAGFSHPNLPEVVLPPGITNLSTEELVLEKRLAFLLIKLHKQNLLKAFHNIIYSIVLHVRIQPVVAAGITSPNFILHVNSINYFIGKLFTAYPRLEIQIFGQESDPTDELRLETISDWILAQLQSPDPVLVPVFPPDFIESLFGEFVPPRNRLNANVETAITAGEDVSSEISSSEPDNPNAIPPIPTFGNNNSSNSDSPIEPRNDSPLNSDLPINSLPEC